jgi:hypothetical protein
VALTVRRVLAIAAVAGLATLLVYLRDPPWLIEVRSGLGRVRTDASGIRYRRMEGRGSFFVPGDAGSVTIPVRAPFSSPSDWPITATFFVDDRLAERIVLSDGRWRRVIIPLRASPWRRVVRIDIHADRTRARNHGLDVGEVELSAR